jgi:hypothetical protein
MTEPPGCFLFRENTWRLSRFVFRSRDGIVYYAGQCVRLSRIAICLNGHIDDLLRVEWRATLCPFGEECSALR